MKKINRKPLEEIQLMHGDQKQAGIPPHSSFNSFFIYCLPGQTAPQ